MAATPTPTARKSRTTLPKEHDMTAKTVTTTTATPSPAKVDREAVADAALAVAVKRIEEAGSLTGKRRSSAQMKADTAKRVANDRAKEANRELPYPNLSMLFTAEPAPTEPEAASEGAPAPTTAPAKPARKPRAPKAANGGEVASEKAPAAAKAPATKAAKAAKGWKVQDKPETREESLARVQPHKAAKKAPPAPAKPTEEALTHGQAHGAYRKQRVLLTGAGPEAYRKAAAKALGITDAAFEAAFFTAKATK